MDLRGSSESLMVKAVGEAEGSRGYAVYLNRPSVAVVTWDPTLRAVHVDVEGWGDLIELSALLEAGLQALTEHRGSRCLADARKLRSDQRLRPAIVQEFFPRALAAGLSRFALVITNERAIACIDQLVGRMPAAKVVAHFATVGEARSWLKESPAKANSIM
jgi:hypothetical protein